MQPPPQNQVLFNNTNGNNNQQQAQQQQIVQQQQNMPQQQQPVQTMAIPMKDKTKPKNPMSAYACFIQVIREEHRRKHPNEHVDFSEFSKKCAEKWRTMQEHEKKRFEDMAQADRVRFNQEMTIYAPPEGVRVKRRKMPKDPSKPKRAWSAFFFFCNEFRAGVRDAHPEWRVGEVAKELGKMWEACDNKGKYEGYAQEARQKYEEDMAKYRAGTFVPSMNDTNNQIIQMNNGGVKTEPSDNNASVRQQNNPVANNNNTATKIVIQQQAGQAQQQQTQQVINGGNQQQQIVQISATNQPNQQAQGNGTATVIAFNTNPQQQQHLGNLAAANATILNPQQQQLLLQQQQQLNQQQQALSQQQQQVSRQLHIPQQQTSGMMSMLQNPNVSMAQYHVNNMLLAQHHQNG